MPIVVDTNVLISANGHNTHADPSCQLACVEQLIAIKESATPIVIDSSDIIFNQYKLYMNFSGEPGVGDKFFKYLFEYYGNPEYVHKVDVSPTEDGFEEFPCDPDLAGFDKDDRIFVAVSMAHPKRPPIVNALDSDWGEHYKTLNKYIEIIFICPHHVHFAPST